MKKKPSRRSLSIDEQINEDKRKEDIFQRLLSQSNLATQDLPKIAFDLEEENPDTVHPLPHVPSQKIYVEYQTPLLIQNNIDQMRENVAALMDDALHDSKCRNWLILLLTSAKLACFFLVLFQAICLSKLLFFVAMFVHDLLEVVVILKSIKYMMTHNRKKQRTKSIVQARESACPMAGRRSYYGHLMAEIDQWESQISITPEPETKTFKFTQVWQFNQVYYILVLLLGLFQLSSQCQSPLVENAYMAFMLVGCVQLFLSFAFTVSIKCCFSQVLQNYLLIARKKESNKEIIQSLKKSKNAQSIEHLVCYLCEDKIPQHTYYIDSPCNKKHYYHEECIAKWLMVHLCCPVCREQIELMNYQMQVLQ